MVRSWFTTLIIILIALLLAYYDCFLIGLLLFVGVILYVGLTSKTAPDLLPLALIFMGTLLYFNYTFLIPPADLPAYDNYALTGYVANYPTYDGERGNFILKTNDEDRLTRRVQVFTSFDTKLSKGDKVQLSGKLSPVDLPGNPGEFDYKTYLARENIYYILNLKEKTDIKIIAPNTKLLLRLSNNYREKITTIAKKSMGDENAGILLGMLLGKKENIDASQYEEFQKTGLVHVFAVSGLHVGFLLLFCHFIISLLSLSSRTKFYVSIIVLFIYGTLVGWPISVIRASIMAGLTVFALYVKRDSSLLNSLGLAGIIIIMLDPYAPFKIAFQLSFAATWGLVYLYPLIKNSLPTNNKIMAYILIPLCAQIPTIPLIAYHFNLFTPVAVISNVVLGYILGIIVLLGFTAITLLLISTTLFTIITIPAAALIDLVLVMNNFLVNLPLAYINVATPHLLVVITYFIGLILIILYLNKWGSKSVLIAGVTLIISFVFVVSIPASYFNQGKLEVAVIDVGQGDSILIKSPQGKFILIDGGGSEFTDVGKRKVLAYLYHRGIRELYLVINTHPDIDHLRGIETVLKELRVRNIAIPQVLKDAEEYKYLKTMAGEKPINLMTLAQGQKLQIEPSFNMEIIHPATTSSSKNNYNNESLVLLAKYQDFSMLLTGDIEKAGIAKMLANTELPKVTVVKVPHHGSKHSLVAELYYKTSPKYGIISVSKNNNFGHPHPEVIEELEGIGTAVLRTDQGGLIFMETDGKGLRIKRPMVKNLPY